MMTKNKKYRKKELNQKLNRGVILLIAVTVASLVLAIGLGISNITTKAIILSSYSKESGKAFYAADAGIECALFWDISYAKAEPTWTKSPFATSTLQSLSEIVGNDLVCAGQKFNDHAVPDFQKWDFPHRDATSATTTFKFSAWSTDYDVLSIENPCVEVMIEKYEENVGLPTPIIRTRISSIGYNTCDENKKHRVSRGIQVQY